MSDLLYPSAVRGPMKYSSMSSKNPWRFGVQVWDVNMQDLCSGSLSLEPFKAVVFVGGFSYADVLGSAKGKTACRDRPHALLPSGPASDDH